MTLCQAVIYIWQSCKMLPPKDGTYFYGCCMPDLSANFLPVLIWLLQMSGWHELPSGHLRCGEVYGAAMHLVEKLYLDNPDVPVRVFALVPAPGLFLKGHTNIEYAGRGLERPQGCLGGSHHVQAAHVRYPREGRPFLSYKRCGILPWTLCGLLPYAYQGKLAPLVHASLGLPGEKGCLSRTL